MFTTLTHIFNTAALVFFTGLALFPVLTIATGGILN